MSDSTQNPPPQDPPEGSGYQPPQPPPDQGHQLMGQPMGAPAPGYGPAPGGVGQPADLLMRFLARLIDGLILAFVNFVFVGILIVGVIAGSDTGSMGGFGTGGSFVGGAIYSILTAAISLGYFAFLESKNGQTVGKMALKLQTQGPGGGHPTMEEALKRNAFVAIGVLGVIPVLGVIAGLLSLAAYIAIAVTISSSPINEGWHDKFAGGTRVIKIG